MWSRRITVAVLALPALALYLLWLWQPERQVRLHTTHFLKKVERRKWDQAQTFIASDYADRWGHGRESALQDAREVFGQFLFLTIENKTRECDILGASATVHTVVKISGNGGPLAQLVMERVNTLREPFLFAWRRPSWKPWDWQLTRLDQPELNIGDTAPF